MLIENINIFNVVILTRHHRKGKFILILQLDSQKPDEGRCLCGLLHLLRSKLVEPSLCKAAQIRNDELSRRI